MCLLFIQIYSVFVFQYCDHFLLVSIIFLLQNFGFSFPFIKLLLFFLFHAFIISYFTFSCTTMYKPERCKCFV